MSKLTKHEFPGSTGCQPVVFGSLPKNSWSDDFTKRVVAARRVAGKLPATTGWQPVLPGAEQPAFVIRASTLFRHSSFVIRHSPNA
jgi:hypothetical protein